MVLLFSVPAVAQQYTGMSDSMLFDSSLLLVAVK